MGRFDHPLRVVAPANPPEGASVTDDVSQGQGFVGRSGGGVEGMEKVTQRSEYRGRRSKVEGGLGWWR